MPAAVQSKPVAPPPAQAAPPPNQPPNQPPAQAGSLVQQVEIALKKIIESVYTDGITAILKTDMGDDNTITGKFADGAQVYNYTITPDDKLEYNEIEATGERSDAYLLGYTVDSGMALRGKRLDAQTPSQRSGRSPKCEKGKRCGGACIAHGNQCSMALSNEARTVTQKARVAIKRVKAQSPTVKQPQAYSAAIAPTGATAPSATPKEGSNLAAKALVAGASVLGLSVAAYTAARANYRAGFAESAEMARQQSAKLAKQPYQVSDHEKEMAAEMGITLPTDEPLVPDVLYGHTLVMRELIKQKYSASGLKVPPAKQITLVANGFDGNDNANGGAAVANDFAGEEFADHHIVPISNEGFSAKSRRPGILVSSEDAIKTQLGNVFMQGRNPAAVRMAATAHAFHQKHPDLPINFIGYSGAGMAANEAAEIMQALKIPVKVANFGSPYWGLTQKVGDSVTFNSPGDYVTQRTPVRDSVNVNEVKDHFSYLKSGVVRSKLKDFFDGKVITGEAVTDEARKKAERRQKALQRVAKRQRAKAKTDSVRDDKACGESFIAEAKVCRAGQAVSAQPEKSGVTPNGWHQAAIAMPAIAGVSAAAYLATRAKYRASFAKSADMAKERAKAIDAPVLKARQHTVVFGVGGMAYADESPTVISGERIVTAAKMAFSRDKGKDLKLVPISNESDNVPSDRKRGNAAEQLQDVANIYYQTLKKGHNPAAVELAAHVLAYAEKNPEAQLIMMGHSRGGVAAHEAQEILRLANPALEARLKSVLFGTQYGGMTEKFGESHTIGSPHDLYTTVLPTRDLQSFPDVKGHSQGAYFGSPAVKQFVSDLIYRDVKVPAKEAKATPKQAAKNVKKDSIETAAYYAAAMETALRTTFRGDSEQADAGMVARALMRHAIATVFQDIASVVSLSQNGEILTGIFRDRSSKFYQFTINQNGDRLRYQQIQKPQRADRGGADDCQKGTPCGQSCVPQGSHCKAELSASTQALVELVHKTLKTEQIPSRAEIGQVARLMAGEAIRNPIKFIREGNQREAAAKQALQQRGVDVPTRMETAKLGASRGASAIKTYAANNPGAVREATVAVTGFVGSTVGGAVAGPVGGIAGEVGTVLVSRKVISDYQALQTARKNLKHDEAFQAAGRLQKLNMLRKASIEELKAMDLNEGRSGDLAGAIMGGSAGSIAGATIGGLAGPLAGITTGVASALTAQKAYAKVKQGEKLLPAVKASAQEVATAPGKAIAAGNQQEQRMRRKANSQIKQGKIVAKAMGIY